MKSEIFVVARAIPLLSGLVLLASACSDDGATGDATLEVIIEAEDVISEGLSPGSGPEDVQDGWRVIFDSYVTAVGGLHIERSDSGAEVDDEEVVVVDLAAVPAQGRSLWTLEGLAAGRWDIFYSTPHAQGRRDESVAEETFQLMQEQDWTYWVSGRLEKVDGVSCPPAGLAEPPSDAVPAGMNSAGDPCFENPNIRFEFGAEAETRFGPCELDGVPGVALTGGQTTTVAVTIHGDHLFFNGFPEGSEGGVTRLAQWMADVDLDVNGEVTRTELESVQPEQLAELDDRYQLGGSPITPLDNMYTYVRAQLKTQGHFQGEGECPADGVAHDHEDDDHGHDHE